MIVYFSGTGNSRWCAELLAQRLGDELLDAFSYIKNGVAADLHSGTPWVFVCPTYAWQLPRIFQEFIRSGSFEGSDQAYFVMTCGSDIGGAGEKNRALCGEKRLEYRGTLEVLMPENYVAMFHVPDEEESARIRAQAEPVMERCAETIRSGRTLSDVRKLSLLDRFKSGPVNTCFYPVCVRDRKFYATDACISCGKCAAGCPTNSVELVDGRPVWRGSCTHCMACICACPTSAIEYGRISRGKPRYQCPHYQEL